MIDDYEYNYKTNCLIIILTKHGFLLIVTIFVYFTYFHNFVYINKLIKNKTNNITEINQINNLKVCICTLGKKENKYIREFVSHYRKYGVDKIFLYDNNNLNDERFDNIISDYIKIKFVEILNYRGKETPQFTIFDDCYKKNNNIYDWLIFYDLDEYINLKDYTNIKNFLSEKKFDKCKLIYLNCLRHTDNDLIYYDNRSLTERFPIINWESKMYTVKTIVRGNIKEIKFKTSHWLDRRIKGCNSFGKIVEPSQRLKMNNDIKKFNNNYIDHYCFKSTEEYINKINKGDAIFGKNNKTMMHKIKLYFKYNKITLEKIEFIEKESGLDLKEYKIKLKKKYVK